MGGGLSNRWDRRSFVRMSGMISLNFSKQGASPLHLLKNMLVFYYKEQLQNSGKTGEEKDYYER